MTPTPEDIALAEELNSVIWQDVPAPIESRFARLIAAHTAPLRELAQIGRLAVEAEKAQRAWVYDSTDSQELLNQAQESLDRLASATRAYLAKKEESKP